MKQNLEEIPGFFEIADYIIFRCEAFAIRFDHKGIYNSAL